METSEAFIQNLVSNHIMCKYDKTGKHEGRAGLNQMAANEINGHGNAFCDHTLTA